MSQPLAALQPCGVSGTIMLDSAQIKASHHYSFTAADAKSSQPTTSNNKTSDAFANSSSVRGGGMHSQTATSNNNNNAAIVHPKTQPDASSASLKSALNDMIQCLESARDTSNQHLTAALQHIVKSGQQAGNINPTNGANDDDEAVDDAAAEAESPMPQPPPAKRAKQ